jgi:hypothetical protein
MQLPYTAKGVTILPEGFLALVLYPVLHSSSTRGLWCAVVDSEGLIRPHRVIVHGAGLVECVCQTGW